MFFKYNIVLTAFIISTVGAHVGSFGQGPHPGFRPYGGSHMLGHHNFNHMPSPKDFKEDCNKRVVLAFYQELFGDHDLTAIDRYISNTTYIQHNPTVGDGAAALKEAFKGIVDTPKEVIDVQNLGADGDFVYLHVKSPSIEEGKIYSVMDIYRLQNGFILEHWDVMQVVPDQAANAHPMF